MAKSGTIIVIEDDEDDVEFLRDTLKQLGEDNKLVWFNNTSLAWDYLRNTTERPFIILCDVNLPVQNGIEFKKSVDADPVLRKKSIPFIFYSTSVDQRYVNTAYTEMTVQGFFQKGYDFKDMVATIKVIMDYWKLSKHPNSPGY